MLTNEQLAAIQAWWDKQDKDSDFFECTDNERFAIKGNKQQEEQYNIIKNQGCCGSMDVEIVVGDDILLYGFNFGH